MFRKKKQPLDDRTQKILNQLNAASPEEILHEDVWHSGFNEKGFYIRKGSVYYELAYLCLYVGEHKETGPMNVNDRVVVTKDRDALSGLYTRFQNIVQSKKQKNRDQLLELALHQ